MISWLILGFLVAILFILIVTLGWIVQVSEVVEKMSRNQENACAECGAYKKMGRHGRFIDHAEWCQQNPRWKKGATA